MQADFCLFYQIADFRELWYTPNQFFEKVNTMDENERIKSHRDAVAKYAKSRYNLVLRPSKEQGERIKAAAAKANQSIQAYILGAVQRRIETEGG